MAGLAVTDLRAGTVVLSDDPTQPPVPVVPQPPGDAPYQPYGVARLPDGRVVAADPGAARVVRLSTMDGDGWEATPPGALRGPVAVALPPGGGIVVADLVDRRLAFLDAPATGVASALTDELLAGPTSVAARTDDLF